MAKAHATLRVVNDQIGTPTYTYDLARLLVDMIETDKYGYYHATELAARVIISWYDFTKEIFRQAAELWTCRSIKAGSPARISGHDRRVRRIQGSPPV